MTQYIATTALFVGTARAHNPGDLVPAENVERNGWSDGVAKAGTKAADEVLKSIAPPVDAAPSAKDVSDSVVANVPVAERQKS